MYAATTKGTDCVCMDSNYALPSASAETDCNKPCNGNNYQYCGSESSQYNVFYVGKNTRYSNIVYSA